jgi:glycosyltransferase involved in cell wall biosynthesis
MKLVSIGLATYNGSRTLRRALDTLLAQTYKNFELIISDNASTDTEVQKICEEYAAKDTRIRYVRQKENIGPLRNFKFVADEARGEFFMWTADDDWWHPEFVEKLLKKLEENPGAGVAMPSHHLIYMDGELMEEVKYEGDLDLTNKSYYYVYNKMAVGAPIIMYIYGLWRTEKFKKLNRRAMPKCIGQDRILMCEAALYTHFASVPEILYFKEMPRTSLKAHHADDEVGQFYRAKFPYLHSVWAMLWWLLSSRNIPFYRKPLIFWPWMKYGWHRLPRIKHEIIKSIS